jgi:hypothetical protein
MVIGNRQFFWICCSQRREKKQQENWFVLLFFVEKNIIFPLSLITLQIIGNDSLKGKIKAQKIIYFIFVINHIFVCQIVSRPFFLQLSDFLLKP